MQPELFNDLVPVRGLRRQSHPPLFPSHFLRVRVAYEDLIFSVLAIILILLAGFCLGVERGKWITQGPQSLVRPLVLEQVARRSDPVPLRVVQRQTAAVAQAVQLQGPYAIQLASYLNEAPAQAEADLLHRKGFNAQVVKQGKYFELRVSGYNQRSEAVTALATLKKTYHDGFVKRI